MSAAAIAVLVALIALTDDRVRDRIGEVNARAVSHRVANETTRVESATVSARDLAMENGALAMFCCAITDSVLVSYMVNPAMKRDPSGAIERTVDCPATVRLRKITPDATSYTNM